MSGPRIGILGGSYDPVHFGHLFVAEAARAEAGLDRILFLPVASPAHRKTHAPPADRRAMVELATTDNRHFFIDSTALDQPAPAYTADTLHLLRGAYPSAEFYFIAGTDSLVRSRWRFLDRVAVALVCFYLVPRRGSSFEDVAPVIGDLPAHLQARFKPLPLPFLDISSTQIRARTAAGQPIRYLTPDPVVKYIESRGLYRPTAITENDDASKQRAAPSGSVRFKNGE
ncbi:MAG: nicotinate (nicotinamide) nucleotide adenylyltransferase [Candidatus Eremiobacteraeota bacterium]|nr:nicotinate (nicotinamide) nucleotide adenylyltransferase [Candidatus Eremiobacteraeota bacterium]MBC5826355.1 nicotinate (nicotinamide) nucleotide adenylyltransferase [Candidatus Eremiobacteraeota bacterium]